MSVPQRRRPRRMVPRFQGHPDAASSALKISSSDYYASIDAQMPHGLEGGQYTFVIHGLTNEDYAELYKRSGRRTCASNCTSIGGTAARWATSSTWPDWPTRSRVRTRPPIHWSRSCA